MTGRKKIILDVDTGHDDAVAIIMAARNPALELVGITVTAGNQILPKTLRNTLNLCSALSIEAPVHAGMTRPLLCELESAPHIHGESGFDGPVFTSCTKEAAPLHAVNFIIQSLLNSSPNEITLVAVGPLTNIAMAVRLEPAIIPRIKEIVLMGGSIGGGNITPSAEFNIHADPEAASIVFACGAPLTMIGLDVTTTVLLDGIRFEKMKQIQGKAAGIFSASMEHYTAACLKYIGECPAMHDPCCIAYVANPSLFTCKPFHVEIETAGTYTRGRTVVDRSGVTQKTPNANVALSVDIDRFWEMLEAAFRRYPDTP